MRVVLVGLFLLSAFGLNGCVTTEATKNVEFRVHEKKQFWMTAIYENSATWKYDENTTFGRKFVLAGYFDEAREKPVFLMLDYTKLKQPEQPSPENVLRDVGARRANVTILDALPQDYTLVASRGESQNNGFELNFPTKRINMRYIGTLLWSVPLDVVTSPVQAGVRVFGKENMETAGTVVLAIPVVAAYCFLMCIPKAPQ
jgi:hypothetical protein